MAFHLALFFSLLKMAVVVALASQDAHPPLPHELYWNSVLPNTQMPKAISQLLQPDFMIKEDMRIPVELGKGTGFDLIAGEENPRPAGGTNVDLVGKDGTKPAYVGVAQEGNFFFYPSHHAHATHGGTNVDLVGKDGTKPAYVGVAQEGNLFLYPSHHADATHGGTNVDLVGKDGTKPAYVGVAQEGNLFLYPSHHAHDTHEGTNVDLVGKDGRKPAYVGVAQEGNLFLYPSHHADATHEGTNVDLVGKDGRKPAYVGGAQEGNLFLYPSHHADATHGGTNVDLVGKDGRKPAYVGVAQEGNVFLYPSHHAHDTHGGTNVDLVGKDGTKPAYVGVAQEGNVFLYPSHHAHATHEGTNVDLVGKDGTKPAYVGVAQEGNVFLYPSHHAHAAHENQLHKDDNPQATLFFLEKDMRPGTTMNLNFTRNSNTANFLPRKTAELIPFSSNELPEIFNQFSVKSESVEANIIKQTIEECEAAGIRGEEKYCATSLESMIDFTTSKLGRNVQAFSTAVLEKGGTMSIISVKKLAGDKAVVCHKQNYPYAVFYCHATKPTRAYVVPLRGSDGVKAKAVAICHVDTSEWDPQHLAFQVLKVKPGTIPICHFLPSDHVVWVPNPQIYISS
ncbi:BURP domain protein RD22-like [Pyrus communis]|uniref:BURP domain protein RD22-like n=1 Tax=Pyrus communis TaxID=23211 RepID=UPI0035C1A929